MHVFVSPHPDDVVLSCAGVVQSLVANGEKVAVLTMMAQDAPATILDYDFIQRLHQRWALGDQPFARRRAEDRAALELLGVQTIRFGDWHDAIYRANSAGELLYTTDDFLFGDVRSDDPLCDAAIIFDEFQPLTHVYLPLGAGQHVDHQLTRNAALQSVSAGVNVHFYEEYPYSAATDEVNYAHAGEQPRLSGAAAINAAQQQIAGAMQPHVVVMSQRQLDTKIAAISQYNSQLSSFWDSEDAMRESVSQYASSVGAGVGVPFGERLWLLDRS